MADETGGKGKQRHVAVMWAPPRTLSTTVERALIENKDIHVLHEPYGLPYYWSSEAGSSRESGDKCRETFTSVSKNIFQDPTPNGERFVFTKNLSYYVSPHCVPKLKELMGDQYTKTRHSFMVRHPAKAISSLYYKSCIDNEKTGYTHFDPNEAGYAALVALVEHLDAHPECGGYCVIDADDLLEDPEGIMTAYCEWMGLPFDPSMLAWEPGPVPQLVSPFSGWTDDVQQSSGIRKRSKRSLPPTISSLPDDVRATIEEAMPIYERLMAMRLRAPGSLSGASKPDIETGSNGGANGAHANGHGGKASSSSSSGNRLFFWGGGADGSGEPCLNSPCCRACVNEPARVTGTILLLVSVLIWVTQAELLQSIHSDGWSKPYFQAASLKSIWAFTLPIWYGLTKVNQALQDEITFRRPLRPTLRVLLLSLMLTVLVQTSSATWIWSLDLTAVSINSAIYNVNPLLVYVFSIPILSEAPSLPKTCAVLLAMLGTSVVTFGTAASGPPPSLSDDGDIATPKEGAIFGNALVMVSATLFALKEVLFKRHFASVTISLTPFTDALLVVGLIGLISALTLAPLTFILDATGVEEFEMPTPELMKGYGIVAVLMATYQACLLAAIALTSPTFVAMGTMLAVPASIGFDFVLKGYLVPPVALLGILGIVGGFSLLMFAARVDEALARAKQAALSRCAPKPQPAALI